MSRGDLFRFAFTAVRAHRLRTALSGLGIAVGIAAVVLLTGIGEGIHRYVLSEFTQFGTNILSINPGRTTTMGLPGAILGTVRPLTLEDSDALERAPHVIATVPGVQGNAEIEAGGRTRRTTVIGTGPEMTVVYKFVVAVGSFLPEEDDSGSERPFAVLGSKLKRELFGDRNPLGARIRIGGLRYRVLGVLESKGEILGFDIDDTIFIPASRALELFDREGLMGVDVLYAAGASVDEVEGGVRRILLARHGREDFTIITQESMLETLGSILNVLTFAVGALGGISLLVGGVGILTIMMITVSERTPEIGLLRALGAERGTILMVFLVEAATVAALGGFAGLVMGAGGAWLLGVLVPNLPVSISWPYLLAAEGIAVTVGLLAGGAPASHAARLDAVDALRAE